MNEIDIKKPVESSQQEKYPTEIITLPSEGYFYADDSPLSTGKLTLRYPTGKSEDILTSKNLINKGIVVDEFLKSIIVEKINYDDLFLGDKNGLMIASRILLYGSEYKTHISCPNCNESNETVYDISELESKEIDFEQYPKNINEFDFELPHSKTKIKFKLLTHKDEADINNYLKKLKKGIKGDVDQEITTRLSYVITEINGERAHNKISRFVSDEMLSKDSLAFREHLAKITPGVDTAVQFSCSNCGHEQQITLPMDINFFWPTNRL